MSVYLAGASGLYSYHGIPSCKSNSVHGQGKWEGGRGSEGPIMELQAPEMSVYLAGPLDHIYTIVFHHVSQIVYTDKGRG